MNSLTTIEKQVLSRVEYGENIRPVRDWLVLLACCAVLLAASALWNGWTYVRVINGETVGGAAIPAPAVDTNAIDAVQAVFEKRAGEEANYRSAYHFVDPSR